MGRRGAYAKTGWTTIRYHLRDIEDKDGPFYGMTVAEWRSLLEQRFREAFSDTEWIEWGFFSFHIDDDFDIDHRMRVTFKLRHSQISGAVERRIYGWDWGKIKPGGYIRPIGRYRKGLEALLSDTTPASAGIESFGKDFRDVFRKETQKGYWTYDNLDALHIPESGYIPEGYDGLMCVPDSFLLVFDPARFLFVGFATDMLARSYVHVKDSKKRELLNTNPVIHAKNASYDESVNRPIFPFRANDTDRLHACVGHNVLIRNRVVI